MAKNVLWFVYEDGHAIGHERQRLAVQAENSVEAAIKYAVATDLLLGKKPRRRSLDVQLGIGQSVVRVTLRRSATGDYHARSVP